jgi:subtilisin family serine protease
MPLGQYIMLPTAPGSANDRSMSEHGDGTGPDDGWTLASGTSSATPQVAAIVALMRQANPRLNVDQIRDILRGTARPVLAGQSHDGVAASDRWCLLPDAAAAVEAARRA